MPNITIDNTDYDLDSLSDTAKQNLQMLQVTIKEFLRVLKPEGYLVITCLDLLPVARMIADAISMTPLIKAPPDRSPRTTFSMATAPNWKRACTSWRTNAALP